MRAALGDLDASHFEVVGDVREVTDVREDARADVLVVGAPHALHELAAWQEHGLPALVLIAGAGASEAELAALDAPGWAIVDADSSPTELAAAIVAAAQGFAVTPVSLRDRRNEAGEDDGGPSAALTGRERDVLQLLSEGLSNKTIASRLAISEHTVKFHLSSIFSKLGVSSRTEAVRRAVQAGLIAL